MQTHQEAENSIIFKSLYRAVFNCPQKDGVTQLDIMALPPELVSCFNKIARNTFITATDFADTLNLTPRQAKYLARLLINKGFLRYETGGSWDTIYRINYQKRPRRRNASAILDTLVNDES
ncbi:MAG: hypothetical protein Kow0031_01040 [Anaerolineae bacterium]